MAVPTRQSYVMAIGLRVLTEIYVKTADEPDAKSAGGQHRNQVAPSSQTATPGFRWAVLAPERGGRARLATVRGLAT